MNVTILECDETIYINQDKNGINIKSWYLNMKLFI